MALQTNKFSVVRKKRLDKVAFNVECNVESEVEIDKILSVTHSAAATEAEILNGMVNYTGYIDLCILYLSVDGEIGTINSSCPFTSSFTDEFVCVGDKVGIKVEVEDYAVESVTSSIIKLSCTLSGSGMIVAEREVGSASADDDTICQKEEEMFVNTLVGQASDCFVVESDFSIKEPVRKIVSSESSVSVKSVESGVNFVSVGGEVVTRLLYLTENDRFETSYVTENFKEEVELEGVTRDAVSEATALIRRCNVKCEVENADKGVNVKVTIPVEVRVTSYLEKSVNVIRDIYSTACELQVSTSSFEMTRELPTDTFEEKIDGALTLDEEMPRVDKIMFVGGSNLAVTNAYVKGGEVFVEGVAKTNVIYLNDETNALHSAIMEVPFVVSDKAEVAEDACISVSVMMSDVDVVVKKGREFLFDAKLKITVNYSCDEMGAVISNVEMADEYAARDCAIELVFAQAGQTAWDVAKQIKVKEETVIFQNPDLTFPLEKDENVVVYYKIR